MTTTFEAPWMSRFSEDDELHRSRNHPSTTDARSVKAKEPLTLPGALSFVPFQTIKAGPNLTPPGLVHQEGVEDEKVVVMVNELYSLSNSSPKHVDSGNKVHSQNSQDVPKQPRSKPGAFRRLLNITKFTTRSASAPPSSRPSSPAGVNAASKEKRDAALRERGLLPPLLPNKDLSLQEQEQDQHIPIAVPPEHDGTEIVEELEAGTPTAANAIKEKWEAKNKSPQLPVEERLRNFKFGSSFSVAETDKQVQQTDVEAKTEEERSLPASLVAGSPPRLMVNQKRLPSLDFKDLCPPLHIPKSPLSPAPSLPNPYATDGKSTSPLSLLPNPHEVQELLIHDQFSPPHAIPLPPSPSNEESDSTGHAMLSPVPSTPIISLTPPISPTNDTVQGEVTEYMPFMTDTESSPSTYTSMMESFSTPDEGHDSTSSNALTRAQVINNIPVVIERSSGESSASGLVESLSSNDDQAEVPFSHHELGILKKREVDEPLSFTTIASSSRTMNADRRKTAKPSKRGQTLDPDSLPNGKGLNISTSLSNMRWSMMGGFGRQKSSATMPPHLRTHTLSSRPLPSPTSPVSFASEQFHRQSQSRPSGDGFLRPRQAVAPTFHSRGSILVEASGIEDEESRALTELAFLG